MTDRSVNEGSLTMQFELPFRHQYHVDLAVSSTAPHVSVHALPPWLVNDDAALFRPFYESCAQLFHEDNRGDTYPFVVTVRPATNSSPALRSAYSTIEAVCRALAGTHGTHVDQGKEGEIRLYVWPFASPGEFAKYHLRKAWRHLDQVFQDG